LSLISRTVHVSFLQSTWHSVGRVAQSV
jgi:hypothetical protein